jgi:predicted ribosome quality control (RQC) complex YloA/Tae2 family protein
VARYVSLAMRKLPEVEQAKALMTEAMEWSVFTWLFRKGTVREVADEANAALDKLNRATKSHWSDEIKAAYKLSSRKDASTDSHSSANAEIETFVQKVKHADEAARRARQDAEEAFAQAERQLNTDLAREGCRKALHQWELDLKAIRCAEAVPEFTKSAR